MSATPDTPMMEVNFEPPVPPYGEEMRGSVRLRTLTTLRWLAVMGQTLVILIVHIGFGFELPLGVCLGAIAASAWLNLFSMMRFSPQRSLSDQEAAFYIAFDIGQLCFLLYLTGGLQNPFAVLMLAPVTIAASILPLRQIVLLGLLALAGTGVLTVSHLPLPWTAGDQIALPGLYVTGVWVAFSFSVVFFAAYAHRIAAENAQMRRALAATQIVLSREERLSALGGLAAAAAHELGTPLATIQVTAQEMVDELQDAHSQDTKLLVEDANLLVSQAKRCRDILSLLSKRGDLGDMMHDQIRLDNLLREAASPFLEISDGPEILFSYDGPPSQDIPMLRRRPEIIYGLRNFIENSVQYAQHNVHLIGHWTDHRLTISIIDDGQGFSQEVLTRLGEPYINPRQDLHRKRNRKSGMGLGFFIAKTLLERTSAKVRFDNLQNLADHTLHRFETRGALVQAEWQLSGLMPIPPHHLDADVNTPLPN